MIGPNDCRSVPDQSNQASSPSPMNILNMPSLDRTHEAMRKLIGLAIPEEPQTFEDWIDDDGLGNGPYKMKLTIWRVST